MLKRILFLLVGAVLVAAFLLVLWAQNRFVRMFDEQLLLMDMSVDSIRMEGAELVIALTPGCPCNAFSRAHLQALIKQYKEQIKVRVILNEIETDTLAISETAQMFDITPDLIEQVDPSKYPWVVSSLSAGVFNADGSVAYIGPVSSGISCTTESSFIDSILINLIQGQKVMPQLNGWAEGCYCHW